MSNAKLIERLNRKALNETKPMYVAGLLDEAATALEAHEWTPIADAPKVEGKHILGFGDGSAIEECAYVMEWNGVGWELAFNHRTAIAPTHFKLIDQPKGGA